MRLRGTKLAQVYAHLHALLYVWTGGRIGGAIRVARGARPPVLLLETRGRRTGVWRKTPLIFLRDGENLVVVAANAGHPDHPAWWLNLAADPQAFVQIGNERRAVVGEAADGARRENLWRRFAAMYDGLDRYQQEAHRRFPVVVLRPSPETAAST